VRFKPVPGGLSGGSELKTCQKNVFAAVCATASSGPMNSM
jgi:hypothetical protein